MKSRYLIKVRRSRKTYFLLYTMILAVFGIIFYLMYRGYPIKLNTWMIAGGFSIILIIFSEIHRIRDWWAVTEHSFVQSKGLLSKNIREVDFSSISDLDLDQHFFKRIINYGNVNVRLFLNETNICIKDIDRPEDFIKDLQSIISEKRTKKDNGIRTI